MTFADLLDQAVALLQQRGRLTYRALKRQFSLDDETLNDLKIEIIRGQRLAVDEDGEVLVWTGTTGAAPSVRAPTPRVDSRPLRLDKPSAERRQLTVMFCDVVEFTPLSQRLDPEDLRNVVRAYHETCLDVIRLFDGHVAQLLGDGLLVYFGWPQAHEDDAQRAVRASLRLLEATTALSGRLPQLGSSSGLAVRIGIHTGLVVVGAMGGAGHQEHLALGETPNVASRIQGLAAPGAVIISAATHRLVQGYFTTSELGAHPLKGVAQPMELYRVEADVESHSRFDVVMRRGLNPLVGREDEVALLRRRWALAVAGQGAGVFLAGEGGIGKSRLVQVMREQATADGCAHRTFRCSPYHVNRALSPVLDHLERRLSFVPAEDPAERLARLEQFLTTYALPLEPSVPLLATFLGLDSSSRYESPRLASQQRRQQTLNALVAWLLAEARQQPVLTDDEC